MYYANFNVNNGTRLMQSLEGNNKFQLWKEIKEWAKAECFSGNTGNVWVSDPNCEDYVFFGIIENGKVYTQVYNYKSKF